MKTFDFVLSYIKEEASFEELAKLRNIFIPVKNPPLDSEEVINRLRVKASSMNEQRLGNYIL